MDHGTPDRPRIMVVDDTPDNLHLLKQMLQACGFEVLVHPDGAMAVRAAERNPPDLILLDIDMPSLDGYEVCRLLKALPSTRAIPVIFLSALNTTEDRVRAFREGGEDFIPKPFQFEEVKARVDAHIEIHRHRKELEAKNRALEASYRELRAVESMRDTLVHMVVHDMRNLLQGATASLDVLRAMTGDQLQSRGATMVEHVSCSTFLLTEMVTTVLEVNKMEAGALELHEVRSDLRSVASAFLTPMMNNQEEGVLRIEVPETPLIAKCDPTLIGRSILNLVANSLKFTRHRPGAVRFTLSAEGTGARVEVTDTGPGVPPEYRERVFDKFFQGSVSGVRYSTGLGLAFAKMAVEAHGGQIGVLSEVGKGSTFWFTLPG